MTEIRKLLGNSGRYSGNLKKKIRLAGKAPDLQKQEPYITAGNLERAEGYLKFLEQERDKRHWEYMKSGNKLHEALFKNTLLQWNTARIMFQILTGSEEVSRRTAKGACEE